MATGLAALMPRPLRRAYAAAPLEGSPPSRPPGRWNRALAHENPVLACEEAVLASEEGVLAHENLVLPHGSPVLAHRNRVLSRGKPARTLTGAVLLAAASAAALLFEVRTAAAEETGPDESHLPTIEAHAEKRSGLVLGLQLGVGAAYTNGYPSDTNQNGDPRYYAASGAMPGTYTTIFVEGALADTVNFGFWFGGATTQSSDWTASATGGGLRVDAFPFWSIAPWLRDLSTFAELGVGGARLKAKHGASPGADGVESYIGVGAFYELRLVRRMLGGHMSWGPFLEGQLVTSPSTTSRGIFLGARFAFYGGP